MNEKSKNKFQKIYEVVSKIPEGRVATYGQIAFLAGLPRAARMVGYALHSLPSNSAIPWHRVINSRGQISHLPDPLIMEVQKQLLINEGIEFNSEHKVVLKNFLWMPEGSIL